MSKHKQDTNFCTALYGLPMPDVNKLEAVTLSVQTPAKKWNVDVLTRENLKVLMNYRNT